MFGPHVDRVHYQGKKTGRPSIVDHIRAARATASEADFDARAFQIFVAGPRNFSMTMRDEEADELKAYLSDAASRGDRMTVISHGTYMDFPWSGAPYPAKFIRTELDMCFRAGIAGLVVHLGKPPPAEVLTYLPHLVSIRRGPLVYLEVPHVKPEYSHYETPEKLAELFRQIRHFDPTLCKFGLCIDTAHLWSCGVDLRSYEDAEDWIRRLEAVGDAIPSDHVIIHLNDSCNERGSGLDCHTGLLKGKIWGEYQDRPRQSGLAAFVDYIVRHDTVSILERKPPEALLDDYTVLARLTSTVLIPAALLD